MKSGSILKLVYISKRMTIGVYEALSSNRYANNLEIEVLLREEGKHTMMTAKMLDELGIETPKRGGELAERFGEQVGKFSAVFGSRSLCIFMQFGEEAERLFLMAASGVCKNRNDRKILDLIIYDEKKHVNWWRKQLLRRRH
jgi:rubrerythrin